MTLEDYVKQVEKRIGPDRIKDAYERLGKAGLTKQSRCLFDDLPEEDKGKPMWLSCPCPKCTLRC